jgi:phosphatidylserine decarboxylase
MRVPIDPAGWPFIGGAALIAALAFALGGWAAGLPFVLAGGFFFFFFRDPHRAITAGRDLVLAPADGRVMVAGATQPGAEPPGEWQQISIFLSPMDVHVNRVPASGRVTSVTYRPGRFFAAYRPDAATLNERSEIWVDHAGQMIVFRQIVGVLARRVVCRLQPGTEVHAGERFGVMKFGSRMDVFLPRTAEIRIKVGDLVRGGETVMAVLH